MHKLSETRILPFTPKQLYDLVLDIESYPVFIPQCSKAKILSENPSKQELQAELNIDVGMISTSYISKVTFKSNNLINVDYMSGPLKNLHNKWLFLPHKHGCKLQFFLSYQFDNKIFNNLAKKIGNRLKNIMIESFIERATNLYGNTENMVGATGIEPATPTMST